MKERLNRIFLTVRFPYIEKEVAFGKNQKKVIIELNALFAPLLLRMI